MEMKNKELYLSIIGNKPKWLRLIPECMNEHDHRKSVYLHVKDNLELSNVITSLCNGLDPEHFSLYILSSEKGKTDRYLARVIVVSLPSFVPGNVAIDFIEPQDDHQENDFPVPLETYFQWKK